MSAPITKVAWGKRRDFSRNVGGPRELDGGVPGELIHAAPHLRGGERRLVHVSHRELEVDRAAENLRGHARQPIVALVAGIERTGKERLREGRGAGELAVGKRGDPGDVSGQQQIDRRARSNDTPGECVIWTEQALRRWRGDAASAREAEDDGARDEILLGRPVAAALFQGDRADVRSLRGRHRDVTPVLAVLGPIADEARGGAEADGNAVRSGQRLGTAARALGHRDGRLLAARLPWRLPEEVGERPRVVRDQRLEQEPRAARHAQDVGDGAAPPARDGQHRLAARPLHRGDQRPPIRVHGRSGRYGFSMTSIWAPSGASRKQTRRPFAGGSSSSTRTPLARSLASVPG